MVYKNIFTKEFYSMPLTLGSVFKSTQERNILFSTF